MGHQTELLKLPSPKSPKGCENLQKQKAYVYNNKNICIGIFKTFIPLLYV